MAKTRKLTGKQQSYTNNRIEGMGPNEAYRESLYSSLNMSAGAINTESGRLEKHPVISLHIEEAREAARQASVMTREEALKRLTVHARVNITDVCDFCLKQVGADKDGNAVMGMVWTIKDSKDIEPNIAACIKSVSIGKDGPKIELYDSDGAIKQLRAMEGWDKPTRTDLSSSDGSMSPSRIVDISDEELAAELAKYGITKP